MFQIFYFIVYTVRISKIIVDILGHDLNLHTLALNVDFSNII